MKKVIAVIILIIIGFLIFGNNSEKDVSGEREEYVVAVSAALTGPAAIFGNPVMAGIEAAGKDINEEGGINGVPVRFVYGDNKNTGKDGITAFNHMTSTEDIDVYITTHSTPSVPVSALVNQLGIPLVNTLVYADLQADNDNTVRFSPDSKGDVEQTIKTMKKNGVKTMVALGIISEVTETTLVELRKQAEEAGISIVHEERYEKDAGGDPRSSVLKAEQIEADAIFLMPVVANSLIEELKKLGTTKQIYVNSTAMLGNLPYKSIELYEGVYMTTGEVSIPGSDRNLDIISKLSEENLVKDPSLYITSIAYDTASVIKKVLSADPDPKNFVQTFQKVGKFEGITGTYDLNSRDISVKFVQVVVEDGEIKVVE